MAYRKRACRALCVAALLLGLSGGVSLFGATAPFGVPVRVSFKFVLNASGNRPSTGDINTDAEVLAQVDRANQIYSIWISELRMHNLEIVDISGASNFYTTNATDEGRDALRAAAMADPATYRWRTDAVNIYITAGTGSAISKFPPDNDIILVNQSIFNTTVGHEIGHSLNLYHTHQSDGADGCTDTLRDESTWDRDDISTNAYGLVYSLLNSAQKYQVDMVWSNLMSYHNGDYRWMISPCQLDRASTQSYTDRNWLLSTVPVYVEAGYVGTQNGSFTQPYQTIQGAINAGVLNNRVMVLKTGTHDNPSSLIRTQTDAVTRRGTSTIREAKPAYSLPYDLENSKNPKVREAILRAQQSERQKNINGVLTNLVEAAKHAAGREKDSIQMELGQRLRDLNRLEEAAGWFKKVAEQADQPALRKRAQDRVSDMERELEKQRNQKQGPEMEDKPKK